MNRKSPKKKSKRLPPRNWLGAKKSRYFYKERGVLKPAWVHKYSRDFGITGRRSFVRFRKTKDPTSVIVYKIATKKEWERSA